MNNFIIMLCAQLYLFAPPDQTTVSSNPINHIVAYESYTTMSIPSETGDQECLRNFYLFSNHLEKTIEVEYKLLHTDEADIKRVTLKPLVEKAHATGRTQTITSPERIGERCDFKYEIINASYVD